MDVARFAGSTSWPNRGQHRWLCYGQFVDFADRFYGYLGSVAVPNGKHRAFPSFLSEISVVIWCTTGEANSNGLQNPVILSKRNSYFSICFLMLSR
jgi:hypothetical protein